ncbi:MAG: hypothetical protein WBP61_14170 [Nocardioides sp.]
MRVYVPSTLALLAEQHADGAVLVPEVVVVAEDETEDAEYAALMTAADASTSLLAGPGRRVVVVVELDKVPEPGWTIPFKRVAAVHVDTHDRPVDADPDEDLGWFATQEIPDLV